MVSLSAVVITFNEERNIGRCLDSLAGVADEIVVIDSYSTDRTEEICREKGVRFIKHVFAGHIEQKNFAVAQAKFGFILSLDADEALDRALIHSILKLKKNWTCGGYYVNRLTNYCGRWIRYCGWYPDRKLRLWKNKSGEWRGINPHDKFELFDGDNGTGRVEGNLLHYSFYTEEEHLKQIEYFTDISSKALFEKGKRGGVVKLNLSPLAKFIDSYFLKLGFLDGAEGYKICRNSAMATRLKYRKLKNLWGN